MNLRDHALWPLKGQAVPCWSLTGNWGSPAGQQATAPFWTLTVSVSQHLIEGFCMLMWSDVHNMERRVLLALDGSPPAGRCCHLGFFRTTAGKNGEWCCLLGLTASSSSPTLDFPRVRGALQYGLKSPWNLTTMSSRSYLHDLRLILWQWPPDV